MVYERGNVSLVELRNDITNCLEEKRDFKIDKKTLKRIIDNLKQGNLVKTVDFLVTLTSGDGFG